jgi:hypothetical protein
MVDYSGIVDGERKLQRALFLFVLGINGRRKNPVTKKQILNWFHGTPESMVVTTINTLCGDTIIHENGKFRVLTFRDHSEARKSQVIANG